METSAYLQFVAALGLVISLILALAWVLRRYGGAVHGMPKPGAKRRLAIVEAIQVDPKRRLVLVRRDDREHLLLLGPGLETIVEAGINPAWDRAETTPDAADRSTSARLEAKLSQVPIGVSIDSRRGGTVVDGAPDPFSSHRV